MEASKVSFFKWYRIGRQGGMSPMRSARNAWRIRAGYRRNYGLSQMWAAFVWAFKIRKSVARIVVYQVPNQVSQTPSRIFQIQVPVVTDAE